MFVVEKKIGEKFPIGFDVQTGETPQTCVATILPSESGGLAKVGSAVCSGIRATQVVDSGLIDGIYYVTLTITCTSGSIYTPTIQVRIVH